MGYTNSERGMIDLDILRAGVLSQASIKGLTHRFYRYPARFSPEFARACILTFSRPGQTVLDPFMGGGTTILEAIASGRRAIGSDINALAVFVARVKTSRLSRRERQALHDWATVTVARQRCSTAVLGPRQTEGMQPTNMNAPEVRWLKKAIAQALSSAEAVLPTARAVRFARCVVLNSGQWALNGRRPIPSANDLRTRVATQALEMLQSVDELKELLASTTTELFTPLLRQNDAAYIDRDAKIAQASIDLVVTSPPYPGVHMLYHRWQVDGRKESDLPYWITQCRDGAGASYYNFADRRPSGVERYYEKAHNSFAAIRRVLRPGATLAQLIAFSAPETQLPAYLRMMAQAGFSEYPRFASPRIWREVPSRKWHAASKGPLQSSREVVLIHTAS